MELIRLALKNWLGPRMKYGFVLLLLGLGSGALSGETTDRRDEMASMGRLIYNDPTLSRPHGQPCADCHAPEAGWTSSDGGLNLAPGIYHGAVKSRFGNRRPPSAAYVTFSPVLHVDPTSGLVGGAFWDGRATGWLLGSPAADQAQEPFLNPVEQNLATANDLVVAVCDGPYGEQFRHLFGAAICGNTTNGYNAIAQALAAYEASPEVNAFSSKYDYYLRDPKRYPLSAEERLGLELFERADKGNCAACHPSRPGPNGEPPLFTDFTYENLGIPANPDNPWYEMSELNPLGAEWVDEGLGGFLRTVPRYARFAEQNLGKYKIATLRNVDLRPDPGFVKAYMHNGIFKSLKSVVHFHNTRDALPRCEPLPQPQPGENCWRSPEVSATVNRREVGDLGLSDQEEDAIVAFLCTLSDGWTPPAD